MKKIETIIGIALLLGALVFNLWLYREEPTSTVDPNDNAFQFGLVERTNQMWDYANATCGGKSEIPNPKSKTDADSSVSSFKFRASDFTQPPLPLHLRIPGLCQLAILTDHWVPNWAGGYNLPYYYSHIPQIMIVGSYRLISSVISNFEFRISNFTLFTYYHYIIYILLALIPLPVFLGLRILGVSWLTAGIGALLASHISTDGLYGLDQSSYLWRGWGLSSQLFAAVPLPLALAYSMKFLSRAESTTALIEMRKKIQLLAKSFVDRNPSSVFPFTLSLSKGHLSSFIPDSKTYLFAILFLIITISGHLGIGMMTLITIGIAGLSPAIVGFLRRDTRRDITAAVVRGLTGVAFLAVPSLLALSYWIIPTLLGNNYHNISFWDPVWKFDSYGIKEVFINLGNGALFDFERMPLYTLLVLIGAFGTMMMQKKNEIQSTKSETKPVSDFEFRISSFQSTSPLGLLFFIWLILYFGRTTWGGLIDLIPGMTEFHISRFIVMIHILGMFLAPIGISVIVTNASTMVIRLINFIRTLGHHDDMRSLSGSIQRLIPYAVYLVFLLIIIPPIYQQTIKYASWNDVLIRQSIGNEKKVKPNVDLLFAELSRLPPGRAFIGRGGGWGKNFRVAETPMYMYMSTYGVPTIAWLPETWSMNSDTEQYFSEDNASHYELYGLRYVIAPVDQKPQTFWKLYKENPFWKLYIVDAPIASPVIPAKAGIQSSVISPPSSPDLSIASSSPTYIGVGTSPTIVESTKTDFINLVHFWIQSEYPGKGVYPTLTYSHADIFDSRPAFSMIDEATYRLRDGTIHSLVKEIPKYTIKNTPMTVASEASVSETVFSGSVTVTEECGTCIAFLRQTYHPSWKAWVDGKEVKPFIVFPFFTAVWLQTPGTHSVVFRYEPSVTKVTLLVLGLGILAGLAYLLLRKK